MGNAYHVSLNPGDQQYGYCTYNSTTGTCDNPTTSALPTLNYSNGDTIQFVVYNFSGSTPPPLGYKQYDWIESTPGTGTPAGQNPIQQWTQLQDATLQPQGQQHSAVFAKTGYCWTLGSVEQPVNPGAKNTWQFTIQFYFGGPPFDPEMEVTSGG